MVNFQNVLLFIINFLLKVIVRFVQYLMTYRMKSDLQTTSLLNVGFRVF